MSLPVGERVGIAFSGGLDTSAAVAWMREQGRDPVRLHRRPRPVRRARPAGVPERAKQYGAEQARLVDCRDELVREGLIALQCGAFHITHRRARRTSTPRRSGAPSPARCSCGRCTTTASTSGATAVTYKGNDIERFYRYGLLVNPNLRIYKPWLDQQFVDELGGRAEMSEFLVAARPAVPRPDGEGVLDRRQHLGRHARGEVARGARRPSMDIVEPIMGVAHWDPTVAIATEDVVGARSRRAGRWRSTARTFESTRSTLVLEANAIGGRHGLGMSDQIENRIIEAKSRGIYEAPGMALLHIAYERLRHRRSTTRTRSRTTARWAAASAGCCTRAAGSTRRA